MRLEAYAAGSANYCSLDVWGQVDGGAALGALGNEIGILAHSKGFNQLIELDFTEINYLDGTVSGTGGGTAPC